MLDVVAEGLTVTRYLRGFRELMNYFSQTTKRQRILEKLATPSRKGTRKDGLKAHAEKGKAKTVHILVTGHSGAGKSTLAKKIAEERGLPLLSLDSSPEVVAMFKAQKAYAAKNQGDIGGFLRGPMHDEAARQAIAKALAKKKPHVIEGTFLANIGLTHLKGHEKYLMNPSKRVMLDRRSRRARLWHLSEGRDYLRKDATRTRNKGDQLYRKYESGVAAWRASPEVTKKTWLKGVKPPAQDKRKSPRAALKSTKGGKPE